MEQSDYLKDITEIRSMMERSSRFISLSGMSGVFAGSVALAGALAAYWHLDLGQFNAYYDGAVTDPALSDQHVTFFVADALLVLILSLAGAIYFTTRKAKISGQSTWDRTIQRLVLNILLPLVAGGVFCLALLYHGSIGLVAPCMLIFYGIALLNGSKYTLNEVRYLGIGEILLGLIAAFFIRHGLIFWAIGFGVLHIIYGVVMYFKYDRKSK